MHYRRDTQIARGDPVTRGVGVQLSVAYAGFLLLSICFTGHPEPSPVLRRSALAAAGVSLLATHSTDRGMHAGARAYAAL